MKVVPPNSKGSISMYFWFPSSYEEVFMTLEIVAKFSSLLTCALSHLHAVFRAGRSTPKGGF